MSVLHEQIHPEGPKLSRVGLGTLRLPNWGYSTKELTEYIENVLDQGITTIDNADIYGDYQSQPLFGKMLKEKPEMRERMELISKCGNVLKSEHKPDHNVQHYNLSKEHIRDSVETTLKDLHTDYLDLLILHRPSPMMDADETAEILTKLVDEGKVRYIGVSNFTPLQFDFLQSRLDIPIVTNQVQCSLLYTDTVFDGTFDQLQRDRVRPMIWSPLGGGELFTGKGERAVRVRIALTSLAEKYECTFDVLALGWVLEFPVKPFPVVGTGTLMHLKKAVKAYHLKMDRQDWFKLLEASRGEPVP